MPRTIEQVVTFRTTPSRCIGSISRPASNAAACGGWGKAKIQARKGAACRWRPTSRHVPVRSSRKTDRADVARLGTGSAPISIPCSSWPSPAASEAPAWPWSTRTSRRSREEHHKGLAHLLLATWKKYLRRRRA